MRASEKWKPVIGYEGLYEINNNGNVRSLKRSGTPGKILVQYVDKGYFRVALSKNNKYRNMPIHRLMAMVFIPNPNQYPQVNHKDGNRKNNSLENLEWCTREHNEHHKKIVLGQDSRGEKNGHYGYRRKNMYPSETIRSKLCELGIPRCRHNIAELGELLPLRCSSARHEYCGKVSWGCYFDTYAGGDGLRHLSEHADTEADARGKMLIYLLEQKLMTREEG